MYFNPPQNDKTSPFFHPLNKVNEEVKTIDKKKAKDIYDKLSDMFLQVKDVMETNIIDNIDDYLAEGND